MLSLVLTVSILIVIYFLQQTYPLLAGVLAVAPVKILATSFLVFEEGGTSRLHDAITGMLIGQIGWGVALFVAWLALK